MNSNSSIAIRVGTTGTCTYFRSPANSCKERHKEKIRKNKTGVVQILRYIQLLKGYIGLIDSQISLESTGIKFTLGTDYKFLFATFATLDRL